nr:zinc finger, CCHC-type [Tanacetum cinerariifolium]GEY67470.1 zinc finger, CCHC-type [Tanacetum cinerariifolium]
MLAILDKHLLKFHACKDAKFLSKAIKNRFGGNKESKKIQKTILKQNYENFVASSQEGLDKTYDRFQKLISQLEIHGAVISQEDANLKLLRSLPSAWNNIALIMGNKSDLDTLSMDDLYNNLKGNRNRDAPRRNAPEDTYTTNALVVHDGIGGYDWSFQAEEGLANFALMDYTSQGSSSSDSKGNPQYALQDKEILNCGCSRHMTVNKSYLTDYQEINGGFVVFGGNAKGDKITRKGKIRTGKLKFEDVYFVKELKFNLFSVSQMCDKKNNVFFTNTECVVLSPDFKLFDESDVLLKHFKAFRFYVIEPNDSVSINSIIKSKYDIFDENRFSLVPRPNLRIPNGAEDISSSVVLEEVTEEVVQQPEPNLRKSKRNRTLKNFGHEFQLYLIERTRDEVSDQHSYGFNVEDDPKTFDEAM